jgi:outer membrane protein TolC
MYSVEGFHRIVVAIKPFLAAVLTVLATWPVWSEPITLNEAVKQALSRGAEQSILAAGLAGAKAVLAQAQAKAGLTVVPTAGYNASQTWNSPPQTRTGPAVASVGLVTSDGVVPQSASAGVTVSTPLTALSIRGTETFQAGSAGDLNHLTGGSLNLTQTIWNGYPGGLPQAAADRATLNLRVAELNSVSGRNTLILNVKRAFYTLLSAQEGIRLLVQTSDSRKASLEFVQSLTQVNQATRLDLKTAEINAASAELDLRAGRSALEVAQRRLANLMGRDDGNPLAAAVEPDPVLTVSSLDEAVQTALRHRVEPKIAQTNAQLAQIDADSAAGASLPSVQVSGGLAVAKDWQQDAGSLLGTVGVSVGVPLIDAGASAGLSAQAEANRTAALAQYRQLLRMIPADVAEAWNALQIDQDRLTVAAASVDVAQGQLEVTKAQFESGLKMLFDVQNAEINLSSAQAGLLKAKITKLLSALRLQDLLGIEEEHS